MSVDLYAFVPRIDNSIVPELLERLNGLGIHCELHPEVSFADHSGYLPIRVRLDRSPNPLLVDKDLISGFELMVEEFVLDSEPDFQGPKQLIAACTSGGPDASYSSEDINTRLARCQTLLMFMFGSFDALELRLATFSAAILADLLGGVYYDPQSDEWGIGPSMIQYIAQEADDWESSPELDPETIHTFEGW